MRDFGIRRSLVVLTAVAALAGVEVSPAAAAPISFSFTATAPQFVGSAQDITNRINPIAEIAGQLGWDPMAIAQVGMDSCSVGVDAGCHFSSNIDADFDASPTQLFFEAGQLASIRSWWFTSNSASTTLVLEDLNTPSPIATGVCFDIQLASNCAGVNDFNESIGITFSLVPEDPGQVPEPAAVLLLSAALAARTIRRRSQPGTGHTRSTS